jgi:Protein of unknown function (DUF2516)
VRAAFLRYAVAQADPVSYAGRVRVVDDIQYWITMVLFWGITALRLWAIVDCAIRKAPAFPAVGKLTKPAWLAITTASGVLGTLLSYSPPNPTSIPSLVSLIVALVYLADVRPAVREVSGGNRW